MNAALIERIETGMGQGAAALFAAAVGYAGYGLSATAGLGPQFVLGAVGAGALAYLPCSRLLGPGVSRTARFPLPDFTPRHFDFPEASDELLLTEQVAPAELLLTERRDPD